MKATPLDGLRNLGPTIVRTLNNVGIASREDLARVGPAHVYPRIAHANPGKSFPVCYYLYSLEGALRGVHWNELALRVKVRLERATRDAV